jgi:hypothetical protein
VSGDHRLEGTIVAALDAPTAVTPKGRMTSGLRTTVSCRWVRKCSKPAAEVDSDDNSQVYADPAGHPFCLCWIQRPDEK